MHDRAMTMQEAFLKKVERFLRQTGMADSRFGEEAVNDRAFVYELRAGRSVQLRTLERVQKFMDERRKGKAA